MVGRRNRWKRRTLGGALVLVSVAVIFLIVEPIVGGDLGTSDQIAGVVGGICGVLALLLGVISALWPAEAGGIDEQVEVETALRHLTDRVRQASEHEERKWGINDPEPLPVRWHVVSGPPDHPELAADSHGNASEAHRDPLSGTFSAVVRFYRSIPTRRMIVTGEPGSGKTVLAHHLVLKLCAETDNDRPTPVLFRVNTWDPNVELHTWLADQLSRDYPGLNGVLSTGHALAAVMLDRGRILPVLDGFDEIPAEFHDQAIEGLSRFPGPLVVTTREAEYRAITAKTRTVSNAAAIALDPLSPGDVRRHLGGRPSEASSTAWTHVFHHLEHNPDTPASRELAAVLSVPLMVMLARTAYRHTDNGTPTELLEISQTTGRHGLEERLLSKYLDTVYDPRYAPEDGGGHTPPFPCTPDQARRWLGFLADHLTRLKTHDLAWWQLGTSLSRRTRLVTSTSIIGIALAIGPLVGIAAGLGTMPTFWLVFALTLGLTIWLARELDDATREPKRPHPRIRRSKSGRPASPKKIIFRSAIVLVFAHLFRRMDDVVLTYEDGAAPHEPVDPWTPLSTDRTVALVDTIMFQLALGLAGGLVIAPVVGLPAGPTDELAVGLMLGLPLGLVSLLSSAWGNWLVLARVWLPLTRRLPWRPKRFLEDAHQRGVLRQAGSAYQFRHAQLRDHLTDHHRPKPTKHARTRRNTTNQRPPPHTRTELKP